MLCITCILEGDHKSHELLSLQDGSDKEKAIFLAKVGEAEQLKSKLETQILLMGDYLKKIEDKAKIERDQISAIFNEVRLKLIEREQLLKKRISEQLDTEQTLYK